MTEQKKLFWLIFLSTCIRLIPASYLELGHHEAYYYTYALHLGENYFDHPPGVAFLIRLFSLNLLLKEELFIRLGAVACAAIGSVLCYQTGKVIQNARTGFYAAVLYNTSIYTSIIAGTFILPDSPQVVFWLAGLWIMSAMCADLNQGIRIAVYRWLLFGLVSGLCILCKTDGIFLWIGLWIFVLFFQRKYILHPGMYLGMFITALVVSPLVAWTINNPLATWDYYSGKIGSEDLRFRPAGFLKTVLAQIACNNPFNVFILLAALSDYIKGKHPSSPGYNMLLCAGLPLIVIINGLSLLTDVWPHWSGPGFLTLSFLAAGWLDRKTAVVADNRLPVLLKQAAALTVMVVIAGILMVKFYPGTIGRITSPAYGKGDVTLDMWGWQQFRRKFTDYIRRAEQRGDTLPSIIVSSKRIPAPQLDYYVAAPLAMEVKGIGLNLYGREPGRDSNALAIVSSNYPEDALHDYQGYFENVKLLNTFSIERNGEPARYFSVYLLENYLQTDDAYNTRSRGRQPVYVNHPLSAD